MIVRYQNISSLVNYTLDNLPNSLFESDTTTFCDLVMGSGQWLSGIIARLRLHGHSEENIASRIFGFEYNKALINIARNKNKIIGNISVMGYNTILSDSFNMKFDVIIGNPPYQTESKHGKKITGNGAHWVQFITKSITLINDGGYLAFVTPDSWTSPTYDLMASRESILNDYFKSYNLEFINFDVKKYFPNVGISPCSFILKKDKNYSKTKIVTSSGSDTIDLQKMTFIPKDLSQESLAIHQKVMSQNQNERIFIKRWTKDVATIVSQNEQTNEFKYPQLDWHANKPLRWTNTPDPAMNKRKVCVPRVGNYQCVVDNEGKLGAKGEVALLFLNDNESGAYADQFYNSNLILFIMNSNKWTQYVIHNILNFIPVTDFTRSWTNQEIYNHFGFEQNEINYIESYVTKLHKSSKKS